VRPWQRLCAIEPTAPPIEYVSITKLKVQFEGHHLASEADVEAYLETYRKALLAEIGSGKRITV
jgi:hypothetical protein